MKNEPYVVLAQGQDVRPIAMCRPVDWTAMAEAMPDVKEMFVYPGSIQQPCTDCGQPVWVGPRLQASGADPYCYMCLANLAESEADNGFGMLMLNMGNPYLPKDHQCASTSGKARDS